MTEEEVAASPQDETADDTEVQPAAPAFRDVKSLADIPAADYSTPDPIILTWEVKGVPEPMRLSVETKYPDDLSTFGFQYLMEQEVASLPEVDENGVETFPNKDKHLLLLRQACIKSPTWLKNKSAFDQFTKKAPPQVVETLHRKLRLIAGLDADFFADCQRYTAPALMNMLQQSSGSPSISTSSPTKSKSDAAPATGESTSQESTSTTTGSDAAPSAQGAMASPTKSGSPPSQTHGAMKTQPFRRIPTSETSSAAAGRNPA